MMINDKRSMRGKLIISALAFVSILSSCHFLFGYWGDDKLEFDYDYPNICFINKCGESVYIGYGAFSDSSSELTTKTILSKGLRRVKNNDQYKGYEVYKRNDDLVYQIVVIRRSTYKKYTKEELAEKCIYDKKYKFVIKQLARMNYTVIYQ